MNYVSSVLRSVKVYNNKVKAGFNLPELKYATIIEGNSFFKIS
jgi:hypothetical protein